MLIDFIILIFALSAAIRGSRSGFLRQFFSTIGFIGGLFLGGWLQPHTVNLAHSASGRAFLLILITLGGALIGLTVGEYLGLKLKLKVFHKKINKVDNFFGALLSISTLLITVWLVASIFSGLPFNNTRMLLRNSQIITRLNQLLPPSPDVIAKLGNLIDPNGFPNVFIGNEPTPSQINLPPLGPLTAAVNADKNSVLRIRGQGCGGVISGSGFVVGNELVATNAHVVAGIANPTVDDVRGAHPAKVIWFDPNLDFAVLKVNNLAEQPLVISNQSFPRKTPAAVLGYPGGGALTAGSAVILDEIQAIGRNIYGSGHTLRSVYEVRANIIPGNSGGPLIATDGQVIGVVFAESTAYDHVGYTLTTSQVNAELKQAITKTQAVDTGSCAE